MSANWNARRILRWTTLAGLLAATVALGATPAAADDNWDWNHRHRHHDRGYYDNGYGYGYYRERPRYYRERRYYYAPAPTYYYPPPPVYYAPRPYYEPSFSFGLTVPIH
jgi:hypothetical protein